MISSYQEISEKIKKHALQLGFDGCGISKAEILEPDISFLKQWLKAGHHGEMKYMSAQPGKRGDPRKLVEGAESVISVILNYYPDKIQTDPEVPKISKYAYGKDYHKVMKTKLNKLLDFINKIAGPVNGRCFVDSAPVFDRAWAARSGLGWIGKNSNLISREFGSFVFIGELVVDLKLAYNHPVKDYCGNCTRCIDACPTGAIITDRVVDSRKCISYQTIENKRKIPDEMKGKMKNRVFGCDICQDVCPWNLKPAPHRTPGFNPHPDLLTLTAKEWFEMKEERFNEIFSGTPVMRAKYSGLKRNLDFLKYKG